MLTVVHISFIYGEGDTGGAAIAATRLHNALIKLGFNSHFVCVFQRERGENVHVLPKECSVGRAVYCFLTKLTRGFWKFTPYRTSIPLNVVPLFGLEKLLARIQPNVVHVHWINADVCSFEQLARLPYKLIFNLHDFFVLFGKGYLEGDGHSGDISMSDNRTRLWRWLTKRRRHLIEKKGPVFIGPSEWACKVCKTSEVGKGAMAYVVPNITSDDFKYNRRIGITYDKFVILFGAYGGRRVKSKGFCDLEEALKLLPQEMVENSELWVFGEESREIRIAGILTRFMGRIQDVKSMMFLYNRADVFAFPSIRETQGMTKVEAMLCGLPVVAFDRTACADGIIHRKTGWIAPSNNIKSFADGLNFFYNKWVSGDLCDLKVETTRVAHQVYSVDSIIKKFLDIYEK